MKLYLVQLRRHNGQRRIACVEGDDLRLIARFASTYDAAQEAIALGKNLSDVITADPAGRYCI